TAIVFVGEGPEKAKLQALASERAGVPGAPPVRFLPFANQSEMPSRYLMADLFVLPSRGNYETWGLAVNEAMHMGVPCLVSDRVGCQRDLVTHGETGWVFDPSDPQALGRTLSEALAALGSSAARRQEVRQAIERRMAGDTYAKTKDGLLSGLAALGAWAGAPPVKITTVTGFFLPVPAVSGGSTEKSWHGLAGLFASAG